MHDREHRLRTDAAVAEAGGARLDRRSALIGGASALIAGPALAQGSASAAPVVLGQVQLSFYAVTGAVVHQVLERLGHTVEVRQAPHEQMFPWLAEGQIDLMAAAWLPEGHGAYWARYGADAVEVAKLYDGARFFWATPAYVPESDIATIADLAKPAVAERLAKRIQGIGPGATISVVSQNAVTDYGLGALGYEFRTGSPADWTGALNAALAEKRWIVFPTWAPQYLNRDGALRPLGDPKGVLGGVNRASLVAPRARYGKLPERTRAVLSRIELGLDGVTEMDWLVNVRKQSPHAAARTWMSAHQVLVSGWFGD